MPQNTKDRRVRRTRRLLHRALRELMAEKRYDSITVQDILDQADVGRTTFYAHYQDKEDLATSMLIELMARLIAAVDESDLPKQPVFPTHVLFKHIEENHEIFKVMMQGRGMELFLDKCKRFWAERVEARLQTLLPDGHEPTIPVPLIADSAAGTFLIQLKWWLDNELPFPAEEMAEYADQLIMPGLWGALGITPNLKIFKAN
jgi:AcrR family transcriptional regulator